MTNASGALHLQDKNEITDDKYSYVSSSFVVTLRHAIAANLGYFEKNCHLVFQLTLPSIREILF